MSDKKSYDKDKDAGTKMRKLGRLDRTMERAQAAVNELLRSGSEAEESEVEVFQRVSEADNRMAVKYYWTTLGSPANDWSGANGAIAIIRRRIGITAPSARSCYKTLERIAEDGDLTTRNVCGRERLLTDEDDLIHSPHLMRGPFAAHLCVHHQRRARCRGSAASVTSCDT